MKPGNARRVMLLLCTVFAISFQPMFAQEADTVPKKSDTSAISGAPAPITYLDLYTGTPVELYYDTVQYMTINKQTRMPVDYYVINNTDTVHGVTGLVVNNMLVRTPEGKYKLDERQVMIVGDELRVINPEGRRVYWAPSGVQVREWSGAGMAPTGDVKKAKGDDKKRKIKGDWGTIKWKKGEWEIEREKEKGM